MKRDMDLVRSILLKLEEHEHGRAPVPLVIDGYTEEQIGYHVYLMDEAGLLIALKTQSRGSTSPCAIPMRMTWAGHDFLDAARSDTIWKAAKQRLAESVGWVSFEVFKSVLVVLAKENLGLPGG